MVNTLRKDYCELVNLLWLQVCMFLIELFKLLWGLCLERGLSCQTLEYDGANAPQICLGIVLQRHDHLRSLDKTQKQTNKKN